LIEFIFSSEHFCEVVMMHPYPRIAQSIAVAAPVLPEEAATTVIPAVSLPSRSALSKMFLAIRSLMLYPGFMNSHLA
jgi:hypothetical protein